MPLALINLILLVVIVWFLPQENVEEEARSRYCDMVFLYSSSNGVAGWPAYKGTAMCDRILKES